MEVNEFINWIAPTATRICKQFGLYPSVCIAQAALESGWGRYIIGEYNMFGRKAVEGDRCIEVPTQEYVNGQWITIIDNFKDYDTLDEAIEDYCILITEEPVYSPCIGLPLELYVRTLGEVYATDPEYADKVLATIQVNNLMQYDEEVE